METSATAVINRLTGSDIPLMHAMLDMFGKAFDLESLFGDHRPDDAYLADLLNGDMFVALAALKKGRVIGGLAAYELKKFEQAHSEFYIYDLAVDADYRRQGVGTALIQALKPIAAGRGASVIFVQADQGDEPAIALYQSLGRREEVVHFDVPVHSAPNESAPHDN